MTKHLTRRTFTIAAGAALFAPAIGGRARAADAPYRLRGSLDTAPAICATSRSTTISARSRPSGGRIKSEYSRAASSIPTSKSARR